MKKLFKLLLLLIVVSSCQDNKKIEQTDKENEELRNQLKEIKLQQELEKQKSSSKKFVWIVINFTSGSSHSKIDGLIDLKEGMIYSDIREINNYDDSMKYRLQDDLENDLRGTYRGLLHSIQEKKTYVFDSYQEASEFKFNTLNNQN